MAGEERAIGEEGCCACTCGGTIMARVAMREGIVAVNVVVAFGWGVGGDGEKGF